MASTSGKGKRKENPSHNYQSYGNSNGSSNTALGPFPSGFKFDPTDEQLIVCYLQPKVSKHNLPPNLMHDIDLYQPHDESVDPDHLTARYAPQGEGVWYFFTPTDKKYPNGDRPKRASGGGYWKASSKDVDIMSNGRRIGFKKSLVFYKGKQQYGTKTNWIMREFRLETNYTTNSPLLLQQDGNLSKRYKLNDWVLCRIHYNTRGAKQAKQGATPEGNIPAQFLDFSSHDSHENVKVSNDNRMIIPAHYNVNYPYQSGESSAYATPEDIKVTYDNTVNVPTQFVGYYPTHHPDESGVLASALSNSNSKPVDLHFSISNNNTVSIPSQFPNNPTWYRHPNTEETERGSLSSGIYGDNQYPNQGVFENTARNDGTASFANDSEIGNTGSANPLSVTPFEFGGQDDFKLPTTDMDMDPFLWDDKLPSLSDFTGDFANYLFDLDNIV